MKHYYVKFELIPLKKRDEHYSFLNSMVVLAKNEKAASKMVKAAVLKDNGNYRFRALSIKIANNPLEVEQLRAEEPMLERTIREKLMGLRVEETQNKIYAEAFEKLREMGAR